MVDDSSWLAGGQLTGEVMMEEARKLQLTVPLPATCCCQTKAEPKTEKIWLFNRCLEVRLDYDLCYRGVSKPRPSSRVIANQGDVKKLSKLAKNWTCPGKGPRPTKPSAPQADGRPGVDTVA